MNKSNFLYYYSRIYNYYVFFISSYIYNIFTKQLPNVCVTCVLQYFLHVCYIIFPLHGIYRLSLTYVAQYINHICSTKSSRFTIYIHLQLVQQIILHVSPFTYIYLLFKSCAIHPQYVTQSIHVSTTWYVCYTYSTC